MSSDLVYTTGTVACTNGSATVTGTATGWAVALVTGGIFSAAGRSIPIIEVVSDTELTLAYPWPASSFSGTYAISRGTSESVRATWINDRLAQILNKLALAGVTPSGAGTEAQRDALDPQPAFDAENPYIWLRLEASEDVAFSMMTSTGWSAWFALPAGADGAAFSGALGDLSDVSTSNPQTGDGVVFTGSGWENVPVPVSDDVRTITKITQDAYDLLSPPDADTLYVIIPEEE